MTHESNIPDQSDREDKINEVLDYIITTGVVTDSDISKLFTAVMGQITAYERFAMQEITYRFDEMIANVEEPYKTILETVIDAVPDPDVTVLSYFKDNIT